MADFHLLWQGYYWRALEYRGSLKTIASTSCRKIDVIIVAAEVKFQWNWNLV